MHHMQQMISGEVHAQTTGVLTKTYDELCAANAEQEKELRRMKKVREEKVGHVLNEYDGFMDQMEEDMNSLTVRSWTKLFLVECPVCRISSTKRQKT